jgi:hypothetical protein
VILNIDGAHPMLRRRVAIKLNGDYLSPNLWTAQEQSGYLQSITIPGSCFRSLSPGNTKTANVEVLYDGLGWFQRNIAFHMEHTETNQQTADSRVYK